MDPTVRVKYQELLWFWWEHRYSGIYHPYQYHNGIHKHSHTYIYIYHVYINIKIKIPINFNIYHKGATPSKIPPEAPSQPHFVVGREEALAPVRHLVAYVYIIKIIIIYIYM